MDNKSLTKTINITCAAYLALFASAVLAVLCMSDGTALLGPATGTLTVVAVQASGYAVTRRRSLLSFSFSFIPALCGLAFLITGSTPWLWACVFLLAVMAFAYNIRHDALPSSRFSTQKWMASLVLAEVMLVLIILLIFG